MYIFESDQTIIQIVNAGIQYGFIKTMERLNQGVQESIQHCGNISFDKHNIPNVSILRSSAYNEEGQILDVVAAQSEEDVESQELKYGRHIPLTSKLVQDLKDE